MSRVIDPGAVFAGWVGLGMAVVVVIAFELIIPVQPLVFLIAPGVGLVIGIYANVRAERWRPRLRALANAGWAGLVTAVGMAVVYVGIRLVFIYADTGLLPDRTQLECRTGPECSYVRYVAAGSAVELAEQGITDAGSFEAAALRDLATAGMGLIMLTLGGAVIGGFGRVTGAGSAGRPSAESVESPTSA
jgi:hypothetical protein